MQAQNRKKNPKIFRGSNSHARGLRALPQAVLSSTFGDLVEPRKTFLAACMHASVGLRPRRRSVSVSGTLFVDRSAGSARALPAQVSRAHACTRWAGARKSPLFSEKNGQLAVPATSDRQRLVATRNDEAPPAPRSSRRREDPSSPPRTRALKARRAPVVVPRMPWRRQSSQGTAEPALPRASQAARGVGAGVSPALDEPRAGKKF